MRSCVSERRWCESRGREHDVTAGALSCFPGLGAGPIGSAVASPTSKAPTKTQTKPRSHPRVFGRGTAITKHQTSAPHIPPTAFHTAFLKHHRQGSTPQCQSKPSIRTSTTSGAKTARSPSSHATTATDDLLEGATEPSTPRAAQEPTSRRHRSIARSSSWSAMEAAARPVC